MEVRGRVTPRALVDDDLFVGLLEQHGPAQLVEPHAGAARTAAPELMLPSIVDISRPSLVVARGIARRPVPSTRYAAET